MQEQGKKGLSVIIGTCIATVFLMVSVNLTPFIYAQEIFYDVAPDSYYHDAVIDMYRKGIITGYPDGDFKPENSVTVAEVLSIIFRTAKIDYEDTHNTDEAWYSDVMNRAISLGIVEETVNPNSYANRLDVGKYIIGAYGLDVTTTTTKDVFVDTNSVIANTMYENNIFVGVDTEEGLEYMPYSEIKRADICLVLARLYNTLKSPLASIYIQNGVIVNMSPTTFTDFTKLIKSVKVEDDFELTIPYTSDITNMSAYTNLRASCIDAYEYVFATQPDKFSFLPNIHLSGKSITKNKSMLTLSVYNSKFENSTLSAYINAFESKTSRIIENLYANNRLTYDMSDIDKARVLFEYVVENTVYDDSAEKNPLSYTGYGASNKGVAVCQGYTALFNKLCKNVGIIAEGQTGVVSATGQEHMWSRLYIDEAWHYIDTTFGDSIIPDYRYFDMTEDEVLEYVELDDLMKNYYIPPIEHFEKPTPVPEIPSIVPMNTPKVFVPSPSPTVIATTSPSLGE